MEETEALVARNNLAEEEAQSLSKFNAEILSHNNPAQRIAYVDRIRQELSEVKQVSFFDSLFFLHSQEPDITGVHARARHPVCSKPRFNT